MVFMKLQHFLVELGAMSGARALLLLALLGSAGSTFRFASYYGDHMVLQMAPSRASVWGYGEVGATVTVSLYKGRDALSKKAASVNGDVGVWKVLLDPVAPGGPYHLVAHHYYDKKVENITLEDVLFGDVWLCGGQSNMEMTVSQIFNASKELKKAPHFPHVRLFTAALETSQVELEDLVKVDLPWSAPTPSNLGQGDFTYFSAVCWLFGRHLFHRLKYPIGLVESVWGGTPVEAWSSRRALSHCGLRGDPEWGKNGFYFPGMLAGPCDYSVLWNAMIHPLLNMTIKGAVWYQGEQNTVTNPDLYNCTFPALIDDWRRSFHEGSGGQTGRDFPFGFVQLSTYQKSKPHDMYPAIRWHQTADYGYAPNPRMANTFMAVAMDLGDEQSPYGSVHPRDKQTVAYRLFLGARAVAYREKKLSFQGPFPRAMVVDYAGSYINITFDQNLLVTHPSDTIFEVLCAGDGNAEDSLRWSPAALRSASPRVVTVHFKGCSRVSAVRYAWADWPCEYKACPIYSANGKLPAPLFLKYL
ncbi:sialate O-acetylesterase [Spea bombifrons]|uniref:sialate O-acetylesterase n=1 Tax=Spea bombifrons TaxID=233779 RepID=UPI00234BCC58|nr:sialate O-acetylesterase [Spea bombifrons]